MVECQYPKIIPPAFLILATDLSVLVSHWGSFTEHKELLLCRMFFSLSFYGIFDDGADSGLQQPATEIHACLDALGNSVQAVKKKLK